MASEYAGTASSSARGLGTGTTMATGIAVVLLCVADAIDVVEVGICDIGGPSASPPLIPPSIGDGPFIPGDGFPASPPIGPQTGPWNPPVVPVMPLEGDFDPPENECEEQAHRDYFVCRALPKSIRNRCWRSANDRFAACLSDRPIPPLITW